MQVLNNIVDFYFYLEESNEYFQCDFAGQKEWILHVP